MTNRSAIYAALFARLPSAGYQTRSRILELWSKVPAEQMPALYLAHGDETPTPLASGAAVRWTFTPQVYVYTRPSGADPSSVLSAHLDAIEAALAPDPVTGRQTLGGLVHAVRIGSIETFEGTLGEVAVAIVTLTVIAGVVPKG